MFPNRYSNNEEIFNNYLDNLENISVISHGAYGVTFLLNLPNNINITNKDLFYKKMTPNAEYGDCVKELVIKFQFVLKPGESLDENDERFFIRPLTEDELKNEVNIQTDIVLKTSQYLQPLCPSIVYADIINVSEKKTIILKKIIDKANVHNVLKFYEGVIYYNIGIIAMELANNSYTLNRYINKFHYGDAKLAVKLAENMSRYALLKLALETEYNHGDFHKHNILIQNDSNYFLTNAGVPKTISPVLIDFGRSTKINPGVMKLIRESVKNKQYTKALSYLCDKSSNYFLRNIKYVDYYGWVCGNYNLDTSGNINEYVNFIKQNDDNTFEINTTLPPKLSDDINAEIDILFQERELALNKNVEIMNKLHDDNPAKYPLLPLSNEIKNKLYSGMIGGKRQRPTKKRKTMRKRCKKTKCMKMERRKNKSKKSKKKK